MNTVIWTALVLCVIPIVLAGVTGFQRVRQLGVLDNANPRAQFAALTGLGARAVAAQSNAWEALAVFVAAAGAAHLAGVDPASMATACLVIVAARIAHAACYLADLATLRSIAFVVGFFGCLYLFWLALTGR